MAAITFLNAVTSIGESTIKKLPFLVSSHTVQVTVTGAPEWVAVGLEGSIDGITFFTLVTHPFTGGELIAAKSMFHVVDKPVSYIRVELSVLTGGTAPTVTVKYEGDSVPPGIRNTGRRGSF